MTENKNNGFLFNMGKVSAYYNGCMIQINARMSENDRTHSLHNGDKLYIRDDNGKEYNVPFIYTELSPAEAYMLAKDLVDCAKAVEEELETDWIITINGHPYWDCEDCMAIRETEEEAKNDAKAFSEDYPEYKWGYRKMTVSEFYNYLGH